MGLNLGAFAAVGALQGIGQGMVHQRNLQEAVDLHSQQMHEQEDYQEKLEKAKEDDRERLVRVKADQDAVNNPWASDTPNNSVSGVPPALSPPANGAQPVPGMQQAGQQPPQQTQGQGLDQPTGLPPVMAQGQGQISQQDLPPPQAQAPQAGQQPPQQAQDSSVAMTPMSAPPPSSVNNSQNIPANQIVAKTNLQNVLANPDDPIAAIKARQQVDSVQKESEFNNIVTFMKGIDAANPAQIESAVIMAKEAGKNGTYDKLYSDLIPKMLAAQQKSDKAGAFDPSNLGNLDNENLTAAARLGIIKAKTNQDGTVNFDPAALKIISPSEKKDVDVLVSKANDVRSGAKQGIDSLNTILGIKDVPGGPLTTTAAQAYALIDGMTGTEVSNFVNHVYVQDKNTVQIANANMKSIGGRLNAGVNFAKFEKAAAPSSDMPEEARKEVAKQIYAQYLTVINRADAITSAASHQTLNEAKIQKFANKHDDENPVMLGDGATINTKWVPYDTWQTQRANGTWNQGTTGQDVRNPATAGTDTSQSNPLDKFMK